MRSEAARDANGQRLLNILWSPALGVEGIDESHTDATLRTFVNRQQGVAYRRLKHFSAYQISVGFRERAGEDVPPATGTAF